MSFREKSAWISLVCIAAVFGFYFASLWSAPDADIETFGHLAVLAMIVLVVLEIVLHSVVAWRAPDARSPADERERMIALRATRIAFYVLIAGALLSAAAVVHFPASRWMLGNAVLFAIFAAELVKFGAQVVLYRIGA